MSESENQKQKRRSSRRGRCGYFREAKKLLIRSIKNQKPSSSHSDDNAGISGKKSVHSCCFCFKQPSTLESSSVDSVTSDANDSKFTFEMLRGLIEKNEFYSRDCNPHLDLPRSSFSADD